MSRGVGAIEPIQSAIPDWAGIVVAILTQLADGWFIVTLLGVLYWTQKDERDELLLVGGLIIAGVGLYRSLKYTFERPRPDQPLLDPTVLPSALQPFYEATAHATGYGFPSGHATAGAIVYFGLAVVLPVSTRRKRLGVATLLVVTVSVTRVALGVHYLVDVAVGIVLGGTVVLVGIPLLDRLVADRASLVFGSAVALNGGYLVASDGTPTAVLILGGAVGLFGGWQLVVLARELSETVPNAKTVRFRLGLATGTVTMLTLALVTALSMAATAVVGGSLLGFVIVVGVVGPTARQNPETWGHAVGSIKQGLDSR
jgi:membrane-associated phospholipid phosphatase